MIFSFSGLKLSLYIEESRMIPYRFVGTATVRPNMMVTFRFSYLGVIQSGRKECDGALSKWNYLREALLNPFVGT